MHGQSFKELLYVKYFNATFITLQQEHEVMLAESVQSDDYC